MELDHWDKDRLPEGGWDLVEKEGPLAKIPLLGEGWAWEELPASVGGGENETPERDLIRVLENKIRNMKNCICVRVCECQDKILQTR